MRLLIQRVSQASVVANGQLTGHISRGLLVLAGITHTDTAEDIEWLCQKLVQLRIFSDAEGKMNLSIEEAGGDILVISQFTLHASTRKGNRPSYTAAAPPEVAIPLYEQFLQCLQDRFTGKIATGVFGAHMQVSLVNDGPVTIWLDSHQKE
ncbi:MAG: D-tyrosyl-tRNA(Tyr) deacylase [Bacteroidetes bacterium]|nr:D-tyrosyl-tRNA(Tyr) deacylase [Bacteroidota bacterium]